MQIRDFTIEECAAASATAMRLVLAAPSSLQDLDIRPGQFVEVRIDDTPGVLLRRPVSIYDLDAASGRLVLLVQRVGKGTTWLCSRRKGDRVNLMLPLGNGFDVAASGRHPLLVGGGVGVAPLLLLGKELVRRGATPTFLLGARTAGDLLCFDAFRNVARTLVCTEDGGLGEKGFVTQHSVWTQETFSHLYVCGPKPMMHAVAGMARVQDVSCEVSLENHMACGLGACLCCVEDTVDGHVCVCKQGPVFSIDRLKW